MEHKRDASSKKGSAKPLITIISVIGGIIAAAVISAILLIAYVSKPVYVEICDDVDLSHITDSKLISMFCSAEEPDFETDECGDKSVGIEFFGFIHRSLPVYIRDTTPPETELRDVNASAGIILSAQDFILSVTDDSGYTVAFDGEAPETDSACSTDASIRVTDAYGNSTVKNAKLNITDKSGDINIEFGDNDCTDDIKAVYPDTAELDISEVNLSVTGDYRAKLVSDNALTLFNVSVKDTVPPKARSANRILRKGHAVDARDLVIHVYDASEVNVSFENEVDFSKEGVQKVGIILTDAAGNTSSLTAKIEICEISENVALECGFTAEELEKAVFSGKSATDCSMQIAEGTDVAALSSGTHTVMFTGAMGEVTVTLTVTDSVPPVLVVKPVSTAVEKPVAPEDFVESCTDESPVEITFETEPPVDTPATVPVTIVATDTSGNSTEATTTLLVGGDTTPPVIYGIKDLSIVSPVNISYVRGVYAVDDVDGNVEVYVDSSDVNIEVNGVYTVRYTASDKLGNTTEVTANVTVNIVSLEDTVNMTADRILASITNDSMSPRDKAWAIYSWCTKNISYSTSTSYLMGQFYEGANSGFNIRRGNCYIYYAVTSVLLTRAGIENIEIQRNDPSNPHYWNLVKIDGSWYHLDTCPHFPGHKMTAFLLTDAEVRAYSENEVANYYSFDASLYPATP